MPTIEGRRQTLRELHRSGCFAIPNPWEVGSARYFEQLGFKATARTPAEFAFSRRLRDGSVGRDEMLAHIHDLVQATEYPPFKQSP